MSDINPPFETYVEVKVLKDHGDILNDNGDIIKLYFLSLYEIMTNFNSLENN